MDRTKITKYCELVQISISWMGLMQVIAETFIIHASSDERSGEASLEGDAIFRNGAVRWRNLIYR